MATHDYIISNASGAAVRADLNNALAAIVSNNSNATSPATTYAYQWWADTTTGQLKLRNSANSAWITIFELDGTMLMEDGSASAPGLAFASDLDTGFAKNGTNGLMVTAGGVQRFSVSATEVNVNDTGAATDFRVESDSNTAMLIVDGSANRVGIGAATPAATLDVAGNQIFTAANPQIQFNAGGPIIRLPSANTLAFLTDSTNEAARIDSSGRVGIGISSNISEKLEIQDGHISVGSSTNTTSTNTLISGYGYVLSGSKFGNVSIRSSYVNTTNAAGLEFYVAAPAVSEAMRLDSSGRLLVGTTSSKESLSQIQCVRSSESTLSIFTSDVSASGKAKINLGPSNNITGAQIICDAEEDFSTGANRTGRLSFTTRLNGTISERMRIHSGGKLTALGVYNGTTTGGSAVYVESDGDLLRFTSSLKYKTDVETIEDARADAILNCRPVWYRSKCDNDIKTEGSEKSDWGWYGFIAEEVAEIEPRLVNWATKDGVKQEDGSVESVERDPADYEAEGVRYDNFVPLLVNLVKRQQAAIETLEAKVAALEAG